MHEKPPIGVSRCLLGDAVRYDGESKANDTVIEQLGDLFELVPVCPEVEAGLTVPRPPVQLTDSGSSQTDWSMIIRASPAVKIRPLT